MFQLSNQVSVKSILCQCDRIVGTAAPRHKRSFALAVTQGPQLKQCAHLRFCLAWPFRWKACALFRCFLVTRACSVWPLRPDWSDATVSRQVASETELPPVLAMAHQHQISLLVLSPAQRKQGSAAEGQIYHVMSVSKRKHRRAIIQTYDLPPEKYVLPFCY